MPGFGVSFTPGSDPQQQQFGGGSPPVSPLQSAIRFLSLRLPRISGVPGIADQSLLPGGSPNQGMGAMSPQDLLALLQGMSPAARTGPVFTPTQPPGRGGVGEPTKIPASPIDLPPPQGMPNPPGLGSSPVPPPSMPGFQPPTVNRGSPSGQQGAPLRRGPFWTSRGF
jgi:hypothetical protein